MSNIQTGAERMPHDLSHLGFLAGQIGRLITISTTPVIAGDSFEMDAVGALRLSPLRRGLAIDSTTRTENILHRNFTRRQVAIQNRVASNIGISQSTFSVKVLNLFSRSRRKTNKRKSKHSAMLRNKETRHRMFI